MGWRNLFSFLVFSILCCNQNVELQEENLIKFGYKPNMKVKKKKKNLLSSWVPIKTYYKNPIM